MDNAQNCDSHLYSNIRSSQTYRSYTVACICSHVLRIRYLHLYRYRNQTVTFFHEYKLTTKHSSDVSGSECYHSRERAHLYKLVYGYPFQREVTIMRKLIFSIWSSYEQYSNGNYVKRRVLTVHLSCNSPFSSFSPPLLTFHPSPLFPPSSSLIHTFILFSSTLVSTSSPTSLSPPTSCSASSFPTVTSSSFVLSSYHFIIM
jgi:hypothetical protein